VDEFPPRTPPFFCGGSHGKKAPQQTMDKWGGINEQMISEVITFEEKWRDF